MARYVCDFDKVRDIGQNVIKAGSELSSAVNTYSSTIDSDLSGWTGGTAKSGFESSNQQIVQTASSDADYIEALGKFIVEAADAIEDVEEHLAGLSI